MQILIKTVPHSKQRYDTVGDWYFDGDDIEVTVSETGDWRYNALVAVHELVEALLCKARGISEEEVTIFDMQWEKDHPGQVLGGGAEEPGDDPSCPCRKEHFFATTVERALSAELGVDWSEYDNVLIALDLPPGVMVASQSSILNTEYPARIEEADNVFGRDHER